MHGALRTRCDQLLDLLGDKGLRDVGVIVATSGTIYQLVRAIIRDYLDVRQWRWRRQRGMGSGGATVTVEAKSGLVLRHSADVTVGETQQLGWRPKENV
jgi:hypothetical protein